MTNTSFAGNNQDTTTNLYDAQFREYEIYGRWPSPDPAGLAAANPANPQSWNRYAYVLNMPLSFVDPSGLFCTNGGPAGSFAILPCPDVTSVTVDGSGGNGRFGASGGAGVDDIGLPLIFAGAHGGPSSTAPQTKAKCIAAALGKGALSAGIDAIGLIPEGGLVSTAIEEAATGYKGIVAIQQGQKTIQGVKLATGIVSTGLGSNDTSVLGLAQTANGVAGLITTVARATPLVGQILSGLSIAGDIIQTVKAIANCN